MRLILSLGFSLTIPFLTIYLRQELGISMSLIGVMMTVGGVVGSLGASIGGAWSDRLGRRRLMIALLSLRGLSFLLMAYLVWTKGHFWLFSLVYVAASVFGTSIFPLVEAIISDVTRSERRAEAFGVMRVAANLGWALGPAIGGGLVGLGYHWLFVATAVSLFVSAWITRRKIRETLEKPAEHHQSLFGPVLADRKLLVFLFVCLAMFLARGQLVSTLSLHAAENVGLTKSQIGLLFGLNGGMVALLQVLVTKWTLPFRSLRALALASLLYGIGYFGVGLGHSMAAMVAAMVVITTAEMIETPTAAAYVSALAPEGSAGAYMGAFNLFLHLGWTVGPTVGGVLLDTMPKPIYAWGLVAIMATVGAAGFVVMGKGQLRVES